MVEIVACGWAAAVTDEQFDELLVLAVSWQAYCMVRRDLDHQEAIRALASLPPAGAAALCGGTTSV